MSIYAQYSYKPEYDGYPRTFGGFGIIAGDSDGAPAVLIKQRNGKGGSPWLFDLPGGGMQENETSARTAMREIFEEVRLKTLVVAPIGDPLWFPIRKNGSLQRVDCAQGFLVSVVGENVPQRTEEAVNIAWLNQGSWKGFNIVGLTPNEDPEKRTFGRTPVMAFDGLSVLQRPFYKGPLTQEIEQCAPKPLRDSNEFVLISGGSHFGKWDKFTQEISLFYRLNPFEEGGRFKGELDHLAQK